MHSREWSWSKWDEVLLFLVPFLIQIFNAFIVLRWALVALWASCLGQSEKQDSRLGLWFAETLSTSLKQLNGIQRNMTGSKISMFSTKYVFFGPIGKTRWPIRQIGGTLYSGARYVALWAPCYVKCCSLLYCHVTYVVEHGQRHWCEDGHDTACWFPGVEAEQCRVWTECPPYVQWPSGVKAVYSSLVYIIVLPCYLSCREWSRTLIWRWTWHCLWISWS